MVYCSKYLKGAALVALISAFVGGSALAVPVPTYPRFDPGTDAAVTKAPTASLGLASGARTLHRTNATFARGTLRAGGAGYSTNAATISTTKSRSQTRYLMSGMVLAALTPLALHHKGDAGTKAVAVETQTPSSSSLTTLAQMGGGGNGNGHGRGGNGDNGNNGNSGGGDGDVNDHSGDNGGDDGEVCDSGDNGGDDQGEDTGDNDSGDCDNGGGGNNGGGGGNNGGGGDNGGGGALPEPGTVPLVGAGLIMALALRSRREN